MSDYIQMWSNLRLNLVVHYAPKKESPHSAGNEKLHIDLDKVELCLN